MKGPWKQAKFIEWRSAQFVIHLVDAAHTYIWHLNRALKNWGIVKHVAGGSKWFLGWLGPDESLVLSPDLRSEKGQPEDTKSGKPQMNMWTDC